MQSEDHYLRVFTDMGDDLLLYRLQDAVSQCADYFPDGLRVHRSFWVRTSYVVDVEVKGRTMHLFMQCGLKVPVSQTYRELVRQTGLLDTQGSNKDLRGQAQLA